MAKKPIEKPTEKPIKKEVKKPTKKQTDEKNLLKRVNNRLLKEKASTLFKSAFESREQYDWEWLTRDLFRRGYQFSTYDNATRTVLLASRKGVRFPINLLWAQMRAVKNQVTNFKPKWEVIPSSTSESSKDNAKYSGKLLDYYYHRFNLRKMIKETVMQGLLFSIGGPWQIGYDENGDKGNGEVYCWLVDPYDFYLDPQATCIEDAEYCFKAVRKPLAAVATNVNYDFHGSVPEKGEERLAASQSKQFMMQSLKNRRSASEEEEEEGVILKEGWIKVRVSESNMEELAQELKENDEDADKLLVGEVLMRVVHFIDITEDPLRVQLKRTSEFPFVAYQADITPNEFYGESWAKHIIPVNRVLNALESSVFTYNHRHAIGRIVVDKNSGVRMVVNEHGSIIEKNKGAEVSFPYIPPLPASYQNQINNCIRYIEDLGGAHEISLGRLPTAIQSGIAIAELKQADASNQSDLVDSLEDFLEQVGEKVLKVIADNYEVPKAIKDLGLSGDTEHFAVVGEKGAKRRKNTRKLKIGTDLIDLGVIGADNEIRVTIGSWLAYTKTARQERIKELYNAKLIDQKTALQHLEFSDIDSIVETTRKEAILEKFRGAKAMGAEQDVSDEEIARQENVIMNQEGRAVEPLITDNHAVHNIVHQESLGFGGNQLVEEHMSAHEALAKKYGPEGREKTGQEMVGEREVVPAPSMAGLPQGMPPEMQGPPGLPPEMPQGMPPGIPPELLEGV